MGTPEKARDRVTRTHEYVYMFAKARQYFYSKTHSEFH